jgi:hypothetical protein
MSASTLNGGEAHKRAQAFLKGKAAKATPTTGISSVVQCALLDANSAQWAFQLIGGRT